MANPYIVIDAPGYYGDEGGRVYSAHATLEAARRAVRRHDYQDERRLWRYPAIVAHNPDNRLGKGDTFYRAPTPVA